MAAASPAGPPPTTATCGEIVIRSVHIAIGAGDCQTPEASSYTRLLPRRDREPRHRERTSWPSFVPAVSGWWRCCAPRAYGTSSGCQASTTSLSTMPCCASTTSRTCYRATSRARVSWPTAMHAPPGATNVLTPLVESFAGSQPVLVLMSDIPVALIGKGLGVLHEVPNQIECFKPVCRWAETIRQGSAIASAVERAFHQFRTTRQGPIALSLPTDLLVAKTEAHRTKPRGRLPTCDSRKIETAARRLRAAKRPLIVAGGGVIASGAAVDLTALAHRLVAPVITSVMGRGAIPETDPFWLGVLPNYR